MSFPSARQLYRTEILHPSVHFMTAAVLRDKIKDTPCVGLHPCWVQGCKIVLGIFFSALSDARNARHGNFSNKHRIHALGIYFVGGLFGTPVILRHTMGTLMDISTASYKIKHQFRYRISSSVTDTGPVNPFLGH